MAVTVKKGYLLIRHELRPGDVEWVVLRHGEIYAEEYGWNEEFPALVKQILTDFAATYDPLRERCWFAELGGEVVGCIFLVRQSDDIAKLRMLLVDPKARGLGLGTRLVGECVDAARDFGYKTLTLWTNSVLESARRLYEAAGFRLVHEEPLSAFGQELVSQTWELEL